MHLGRTYPFLFERWKVECFFWPGYIPRKLHVSCPAGFGSSWARLSSGVVTDVGIDYPAHLGDVQWWYTDPSLLWQLRVIFHQTVVQPKEYGIFVQLIEFVPVVTSVIGGRVLSPQYTFGGWSLETCSNFPPYSLGVVPPLSMRPATWSEV
jgi:hypothetical protein